MCYDTNFEEAAVRKQAKYEDLAMQARGNGYHTTILTIQVGSRGVPDRQSFSQLATILGILDWDDETRKLCLLELTVCFETPFEEAAQRKKIRYADIVDQARLSHYISKLITVEVGQGVLSIWRASNNFRMN